MGSRLKTLLSKFSLSDRMYGEVSKKEFTSPDFCKTDAIITKERENAIGFLKMSMENNLQN